MSDRIGERHASGCRYENGRRYIIEEESMHWIIFVVAAFFICMPGVVAQEAKTEAMTAVEFDWRGLNSCGEPDDVAVAGQVRSAWAHGKVLAVEQFGDRFDVKISIGEDDGIVVGLQTVVYIGPELAMPNAGRFPMNYVATGQVVDVQTDGATCNIGPSLGNKANGVPMLGHDVLVRRKLDPATFIVAKHVVLHERRIIRWEEVRDRLAELNEQGLIEPTVVFTAATREVRDQRSEDFGKWCEETTGGGFNSRSLSDSIGEYYDSIITDEDLRPAAARKIGTVMANGTPVADAEIVLYTLAELWTHEVYIEHGRLRSPEDEKNLTHSAPNGRFAVYPDAERFQILVLHEKGMALVNSDQWSSQEEIELLPWAQISGKFDGPIEYDETAQFETRFNVSGWATICLEVWDTPLFADRSFQNRRVPPGKIIVTRAVKSPRGGAAGITHDSFNVASGETRSISIGKHTSDGRKRAEEYLNSENR